MNKELEAFSRIMETYGKTNSLEGTYNDFSTIKKALLKMQEQEKILKIIDKKNVDMLLLTNADTLEEYNSKMNWSYRRLTQEEFDTLKEWMRNE